MRWAITWRIRGAFSVPPRGAAAAGAAAVGAAAVGAAAEES